MVYIRPLDHLRQRGVLHQVNAVVHGQIQLVAIDIDIVESHLVSHFIRQVSDEVELIL